MRLREVIEILNAMRADGVIDRYAIGGAMGATFYLEPVTTLDVDVFIELHAQANALLIDLGPIYEYLEKHGGVREREYIVVADTPVQFLMPPADSLTAEALAQAVERDFDGLSACIFTGEHIAAVALQTGRTKDKLRVAQFLEADTLDAARFRDILARHGLTGRWEQFERNYLADNR